VVPHAAYQYSGQVAATAYALLQDVASIRHVVLLGPAHFVFLTGCAVSGADAWTTPLGAVACDAPLRLLVTEKGASTSDAVHEGEHALEVQVPFLQRILEPGFAILPVAVGRTDPAEVAELISALSAEPDTMVVVSTDLSHYHDEETAKRLDRETARAVVDRDPWGIGEEAACGVFALRAIVEHARRNELGVRLLDLRTSADVAGDRARVVGYGAFAVG
jgi:AmmeMemoRadiSam system protein B